MKKIIALSIGLLIFSGSFFTARAEAPLTGEDIRHFMDAMKPLQKLGEKYDIGESNDASAEDIETANFSPMTRSLKKIKAHKAYPEFETTIKNAGFSSAEQWASVGDRVMRAYMSLKIQQAMTPEKRQKMQKSIAEIENNGYLSAETKKQILNNLKRAMAMANNLSNVTKADQEALKPYLAKLERLFEER